MRRLMYRWLLPAAVVLPAVLFIGWIVFSRDGWALLPTVLIFIPSVFVGQLVLALLVRSRTSVRESKAVSWPDVGAFAAWHLLTVLVAWFSSPAFGITLTLAIIAGLGTFWLVVWELWTESKRSWTKLTDTSPRTSVGGESAGATPSWSAQPTIIVHEATDGDARGGFGSR